MSVLHSVAYWKWFCICGHIQNLYAKRTQYQDMGWQYDSLLSSHKKRNKRNSQNVLVAYGVHKRIVGVYGVRAIW